MVGTYPNTRCAPAAFAQPTHLNHSARKPGEITVLLMSTGQGEIKCLTPRLLRITSQAGLQNIYYL